MPFQLNKLIACCFLFIIMVSARSLANQEALAVELSLEKETLVIGEPLVIRFEVKNLTDVYIHADVLKEEKGFLKVEIQNQAGKAFSSAVLEYPPVEMPVGWTFYASGARIPGHQSFPDNKVVPLRLSEPGNYRVTIKMKLSYEQQEEGYERKPELLTLEKRFDVTVKKANSKRLKEVIASYQAQAVNKELRPWERQSAQEALLSFPEKSAFDAWQATVQAKHLPTSEKRFMIDRLSQIGTVQAAILIAGLWDDPEELEEEVRLPAMRGLTRFLKQGDSDAKRYVETLFAQKGIQIDVRKK